MSEESTDAPLQGSPVLPWSMRLRSNLIQAPLIFAATAAFGSVSLAASLWDKGGLRQHRIARSWARLVMRISRSPVTVTGKENLLGNSPAVYACNHLSYMDTPVIFSALPFQFRILARSDLWKLPFVGWHLKRSGQIPVNAENPRASITSLNQGIKALKTGMPLFVFPEGGRAHDGRLGELMSGPAFMAVRGQAPLVPMALMGTYELLPIHTHHLRPQPLHLAVGKPIETKGCTTKSVTELTERLRKAILALLPSEAAGMTLGEHAKSRWYE